jgi:hypothetical protein
VTIYTFDQSDFYIDENAISDFVDDNGETVILADGEGEGGGGNTAFFGFLHLALRPAPSLADHLKKLLSAIDARKN